MNKTIMESMYIPSTLLKISKLWSSINTDHSDINDHISFKELFESILSIVCSLTEEGSFKPSIKIYPFHKQATYGPNDTP